MKIYDKLLIGAMSIASLTACVNEDSFGGFSSAKDTGIMELSVDVQKPQTRADEDIVADDFPVIIYDAEKSQIMNFATVKDVPQRIILPVGSYDVVAHSPYAFETKMPKPYYEGNCLVDIEEKGHTYEAKIVCKMKNSQIVLSLDEKFRSQFSSWTVTLDNGSKDALSFSSDESESSFYWYFGEEGTKLLTLQFVGTLTEGGKIITDTKTLTKEFAEEQYDNDRENFCGGDKLNISISESESTSGKIENITINADVTFTPTGEQTEVNVYDKDYVPDDVEDGGNDADGITLNLPKPISYPVYGADDVDPKLGDTEIGASAGLKSIMVNIESTSDEMLKSLADLKEEHGVDFVGGAEIVGNQSIVNLFVALDQPLSVPARGDKTYVFPIGNFFGLLQVLEGKHTFNIVVTDMNGETKSGKVEITVGNPGQGGGDADGITLNLPAPISYPVYGADDVDPKLGDTYIAATSGLKSLTVKIVSTSDDMLSSLADLKDEHGVDFISGAEIVGNQSVVNLFVALDQPLSVPAQGDKEYTFPIGNFFGLLQVLQGEHTFNLEVTDMDGNKKNGAVKITIE